MFYLIQLQSLNYLAAAMFYINKIAITQFKNYNFSSFDFKERIIGICGLNGKGKTNLLDAVYYCCFTKSYFSKTDGLNVQFEKDGFRIEASSLFSPVGGNEEDIKGDTSLIGNERLFEIVCIYRGVGKKELLLNGIPYNKLSEHIGKFPAVMVAPDDIELITGGSEERRRYIDTIISQMDSDYLAQLIQYNKVLLQRNSLLKRFAEQGKTDWPLLEVLDEQLVKPGYFIYKKRNNFMKELIPLVQNFYEQIAGNNEAVTLEYESQLKLNSFESILNEVRQKDFLLQRSNGGIHKDDISMLLNDQSFKNTASQGQRKSLLFALKLAEFELLKINKGFAPLLFLDDVFEKLDDIRMQHLLNWVCIKNTGQVFITDTHRERLENAFKLIAVRYQVIEL